MVNVGTVPMLDAFRAVARKFGTRQRKKACDRID